MKIFLDDVRFVPSQFDKFFRSAESLIAFFEENPSLHIEELSLDHDLGLGKLNGAEFTKILVEHFPDLKIDYIRLHTANTIGWRNMYSILTSAKKIEIGHFKDTIIDTYFYSCIDERMTPLFDLSGKY